MSPKGGCIFLIMKHNFPLIFAIKTFIYPKVSIRCHFDRDGVKVGAKVGIAPIDFLAFEKMLKTYKF